MRVADGSLRSPPFVHPTPSGQKQSTNTINNINDKNKNKPADM